MRHISRRRVFAVSAVLAGALTLPSAASAQDEASLFRLDVTAAGLESISEMPQPIQQRALPRRTADRPNALLPLYASLGVLQGLDVHSTSRGLAAGRREANPVMEPIVGNRAAFIGVKAATTAGVVWASERLWRKNNRKAAVILTALTNVGLAAVVAHNYRAAK